MDKIEKAEAFNTLHIKGKPVTLANMQIEPETPSVRHTIYSVLFISIIWTSSLLFLLFGLPVLVYQSISSLFAKKG